MLDSFVNHSDIIAANRLDAEYFQPKFLDLREKLKSGKYRKLHELCEFIRTGPAGSVLPASKYTSSGIKVYRPSNLNGWTCDNSNIVYVSEEYCSKQNLKLYSNGDILVTRIGDIKFAIIQETKLFAISPNLFVIRTKKDLLDPYFLLVFLNTWFGADQILRGQKIVSLASVDIGQVANMLVPLIPVDAQIKIGKLVKNGLKKLRQAKEIHSQTESALVQIIGHQKSSKDQSSNIINFSELLKVRRADAEYFLAQKFIGQESIKWMQIGEISRVMRGIEPGRKAYQKNGKLFMRVSNIDKYGLLEKSQKYISEVLYKKLYKKYQPQISEILLVKDGKPGVAFVVKKSIKGIISDGIVRLQLNTLFAPEYVSLCINSPICQQQILADIDGSLVPHWKVEQIKNLKIPIVSANIQAGLVRVMKKSGILFQKAEENLLLAKYQIILFMPK